MDTIFEVFHFVHFNIGLHGILNENARPRVSRISGFRGGAAIAPGEEAVALQALVLSFEYETRAFSKVDVAVNFKVYFLGLRKRQGNAATKTRGFVIGATAGATAISVLAPNWLAKRVAALEPADEQ